MTVVLAVDESETKHGQPAFACPQTRNTLVFLDLLLSILLSIYSFRPPAHIVTLPFHHTFTLHVTHLMSHT